MYEPTYSYRCQDIDVHYKPRNDRYYTYKMKLFSTFRLNITNDSLTVKSYT